MSSYWKCPANAYFEETDNKHHRKPGATTVTTLQDDIKRTLEKMMSFSVKSLKSLVDLHRVCNLDRILCWSLIGNIYKIAEDKKLNFYALELKQA